MVKQFVVDHTALFSSRPFNVLNGPLDAAFVLATTRAHPYNARENKRPNASPGPNER